MFLPQNPFLCDSICESAHLPCLTLLLASVSLSCCGKQSAGDLVTSNSGRFFHPCVSRASLTCFSPHLCQLNCQVFASTVSPCIILVPCQTRFFVPSVSLKACRNISLYVAVSCLTLKVCGRPHAVHTNSAS